LKRKLETLRKIGKLLLDEEREIKENLSKVQNRILILQGEVRKIEEEIENWTNMISKKAVPADEVAETYSYIESLLMKLKRINKEIEEAKQEERELETLLLEKKREIKSFESVERKVKEAVLSEERLKETQLLDEHTRIKRWIKRALSIFILFLSFQPSFADSGESLEKTPPALVKVLKKREMEIEKRESEFKIREKFLETLKEDVSFLLNVIDEKLKKATEVSYGASSSSTEGTFFPSLEVKKLYKLISRLPPDEGGQILSNVKPEIVAFLLLHVNSMQAANLLANMEVKRAARVVEILYALAPQKAKNIFKKLNKEKESNSEGSFSR